MEDQLARVALPKAGGAAGSTDSLGACDGGIPGGEAGETAGASFFAHQAISIFPRRFARPDLCSY